MRLEKIQFRRMLYPPGHLLGCAQDATVPDKSVWILLVCKYGLGEILYPNLFAGSDFALLFLLPQVSQLTTEQFVAFHTCHGRGFSFGQEVMENDQEWFVTLFFHLKWTKTHVGVSQVQVMAL